MHTSEIHSIREGFVDQGSFDEKPGATSVPSRRIALLVGGLNFGGTETQVTVLANGLARLGHSVSLLMYYPGGPLRARVSPNVSVRCFERRGQWDVLRVLRRLLSVLHQDQPDVLYTFLPGPNTLACFAGLCVPKLRVAWGVRASDVELGRYPWLTRLSYLLERQFSRWPHLIISNSVAGRRHAVAHGFPDTERFIVIPNGIDVERFRPDAELGQAVRKEWGVLPGQTLIGIVARLDPMKDYPTVLEAAAKLVRCDPTFRFVGVGTGPDDYAALLREKSRSLGLDGRMIWAGPRGDLPAVYNALDLLVSSSAFGEGFSNALGEAMACGVPCVATDVGDARQILGDTGVVVPPCDPEGLAGGIMASMKRLRLEGATLQAVVRKQVKENFSVDTLVRRTSGALETLVCRT